jgi:hypothetical protein
MANDFTLLPFARPGLMTSASGAQGNAARLGMAYSAQILINGSVSGATIPLGAELRGPGDVLGFDNSLIVATDPAARGSAFEANYFPYVEFGPTDFPWRFTLDTAVADGRLQPWITLIALTADEFEAIPPVSDLPRAIRVFDPAKSLPPVADLLFSAHVHLDGAPAGSAAIAGALSDSTFGSRSRLLCTRKLAESTAYFLFVVPTYELGRLAGLGQIPQASPPDKPAWTNAAGAVELPYYWSHSFLTNSGEDIEAMLRRLRAINAADNSAIGAQERIFAGDPGHYPGYSKPDAEFLRQAATNDPGDPPPGFSTEPNLVSKLADTLNDAIKGERVDETRSQADLGQSVEDPLVTFPAYGFRYREEERVNKALKEAYWFNHINLDLKFRDAAARGAEIVRLHQDHYMQLSWEQYEGIVEANARLARLQAAEQLAVNLTVRRLSNLEPSVALALAEPVWSLGASKTGTSTVRDELGGKGAPTSYAGRAMRRLASKRQRAPLAKAGLGLARAMPVPSLPGDRDAKGFKAVDRSDAAMHARIRPLPGVPVEAQQSIVALMGADYIEAAIPQTGAVAVAPISTTALAEPIISLMTALPRAKAEATIGGLSEQETRQITPVYRGPVISDPLAERLREISIDALIPGLAAMPDNTVTFLEENRPFIEAFMVGANHEINSELRWRGFPTDMRSTVFHRFWQHGYAPADPRGNDIDPIHGWTGALGSNPSSNDADQLENLVMIIKGDIIRKIGMPIIEINIATGPNWSPNSGQVFEPKFFGLAGDAAYFGFDVARSTILSPATRDRSFLVIYEPPGRIRFGLDVGTQARRLAVRNEATVRRPFPISALGGKRSYALEPAVKALTSVPAAIPTWDDLSWSHVLTHSSGYVNFSSNPQAASGPALWGGSKTSATIARSFWQKPVAAVLPLARVL